MKVYSVECIKPCKFDGLVRGRIQFGTFFWTCPKCGRVMRNRLDGE